MKNEKNIIGIYPNAFPSDLCDTMIEYFDANPKKYDSTVVDFKDGKPTSRPDEHRVSEELTIPDIHWLSKKAHKIINPLVIKFCKKYAAVLRTFNTSYYENLHILKYEPNKGHYDYHSDADGPLIYNRMISIIVYFNDVKEGGETEFEYIDVPPVKPKKGTIVIFPSGWTHQHRGNIPISNEKYIGVWWLRAKLNGK